MDSKKLRLQALRNALELARTHVVEVGGNNRGPVVSKIIRYAEGQVGEPWCVDTVIHCYGKAGSTAMRPGSPRAVSEMVQPGVHTTHYPKPGCPVRYVFDHTGLFVGWRRQIGSRFVRCPRRFATHIRSVEGNTGPTGAVSDSRNGGDGVYEKHRPLNVISDFLYVTR